MAIIASNLLPMLKNGSTSYHRLVTETVLGASDTFAYMQGTGQTLFLRNITAGALTVLLNGSANLINNLSDGFFNFDTTAGYSTGSIAAGAIVAIPLDTIRLYLQGTIAVTGGSGISAYITSNT